MARNKEKKLKTSASKERKLPKFYVLDAVILLLIVAICLGVYFRYSVFDALGNSKKQVDVEVSFAIKNIQDTTTHYLDIGDEVYVKADGTTLGTLLASDDNSDMPLGNITPAAVTFFEGGESFIVNYPSETRVDAEGRLLCKGLFSQDGSFMLNGNEYLSAGQTVTVCTERVTVEIIVLDIKEIAD